MRFFETTGNAIVIAFDERPVLTTDPWINGDAYFGSWGDDYEIAPAQMQAIRDAKYHWFSHGHHDHLNVASLPTLTGGQFLLSDHYGSRIQRDLAAAGHDVRVLPDREWVQLSKGIRVYSVANQNQDSMLLIDLNGRLIINQNDSTDRLWRIFPRPAHGKAFQGSLYAAVARLGRSRHAQPIRSLRA